MSVVKANFEIREAAKMRDRLVITERSTRKEAR